MNFQDSADALSHLLRVHVLDIQPPNTYSAGQYLLQLGCSTPFTWEIPLILGLIISCLALGDHLPSRLPHLASKASWEHAGRPDGAQNLLRIRAGGRRKRLDAIGPESPSSQKNIPVFELFNTQYIQPIIYIYSAESLHNWLICLSTVYQIITLLECPSRTPPSLQSRHFAAQRLSFRHDGGGKGQDQADDEGSIEHQNQNVLIAVHLHHLFSILLREPDQKREAKNTLQKRGKNMEDATITSVERK